nr:FkbM family methyltransferase [Leptospira yasudae]
MIFDKILTKIRNLKNNTSKSTSTMDFVPSYSQEGEDMILREIFQGKTEGFYVDIGAYDPIRFSNTNYFYQLGWKGINVEPSPDGIERFNLYRKNDINLNAGISREAGKLKYYVFEEAALNTFDSKRVEYLEMNSSYRHQSSVDIPVYSLASILSKYCPGQKIDFMNIDVEWHEMEVLQSNDWDQFRPKVLLIEILDFDLDLLSTNRVHNFLKGIGYKFECKTPRTSFYLDQRTK